MQPAERRTRGPVKTAAVGCSCEWWWRLTTRIMTGSRRATPTKACQQHTHHHAPTHGGQGPDCVSQCRQASACGLSHLAGEICGEEYVRGHLQVPTASRADFGSLHKATHGSQPEDTEPPVRLVYRLCPQHHCNIPVLESCGLLK